VSGSAAGGKRLSGFGASEWASTGRRSGPSTMQVQRVCPGLAELAFDHPLERSEFASCSHARSGRRDSSVYICSTMKWPNLSQRSNRTFALMCFAPRLRTPRFSRWIKDKDWQRFKSDGYMVIRDVIPTCLTTKAVLDIAALSAPTFATVRRGIADPSRMTAWLPCITPSRFGISDSIRDSIRYSVNIGVRTS